MKQLLVVLFLILSACGSGGGGSGGSADSGRPDGIPATCKSLYDVWQSTTDSERHNFSTLPGQVIEQEYEYRAHDGTTCGYVGNPNHNLTAQIIPATTATIPWQYQLKMRYSLAMGGQCATYEVNGSSGLRDQVAYIVMPSCNVLQICEDAFATTLGTCKTFQ